MNKKERVLAAINFKTVDRIPTMFRSISYISISLMKKFGIGRRNDPDLLVNNFELFKKELNVDFWSSGCNIGKFSTFIPEYIGPELKYKDVNYYSAVGIPTSPKTIEKYDYSFTEITGNPLARCDSPEKVEGFLTGKLDRFDFNNLINNIYASDYFADYRGGENKKDLSIESFAGSDEDFICLGNNMNNIYMMCSYLRGMDNFLLDLAGNKKMAEAVIREVGEFVLEYNRRYLKGASGRGEYFGSWDDVAMQNGMMFSPQDFKKYFLSYWKKLISMVKSEGMIFSWHCCGNVEDVLPMMIDAGIDVFDVVQTSARNMEIERFYKRFGNSICIHGGIDVQRLLSSGTSGEIREEVKKIKHLWGERGGIILGPSHEIVPESPLENVLALYEELRKE